MSGGTIDVALHNRAPREATLVFPIATRRRNRSVGHPLERDVVEDIRLASAPRDVHQRCVRCAHSASRRDRMDVRMRHYRNLESKSRYGLAKRADRLFLLGHFRGGAEATFRRIP